MKLKFAVLALLVAAGTAVAGVVYPVQVYFGDITSTTDITAPASLTLNGVTFQLDPQGDPTAPTASADSSGIFGSTLGALNLFFDYPAMGLRLDFSVLGAATPLGCDLSCLFPDALITGDGSSAAGTFTRSAAADANGNIFGSLDYTATIPFSLVTLYFESSGSDFTVGNVSFDSTVPEPASFILIGTALLGLGCARRLSRRRS